MSYATHDTILAVATPPGRAGVAVVRVSGAKAKAVAQVFIGEVELLPRRATLRHLRHPATQEPIDQALMLWFPAPGSFTGEDVLEMQVHGSPAVMERVLELACGLPDVRVAEPGEFSHRAFLHGKMDVLEAEGLADLIEAQTASQHAQALRQMEGKASEIYADFRASLQHIQALLEAYVDFPDEDIPAQVWDQVVAETKALKNHCVHQLGLKSGERVREGVRIVLAGAPNVGKSSLLNALAKRDVAIISPQAGTTRDVLEVTLNIGGVPATLYDTAGLHESDHEIEREGMRRTRAQMQGADLILYMVDATHAPNFTLESNILTDKRIILLVNKVDLVDAVEYPKEMAPAKPLELSVQKGIGMEALLEALRARCVALVDQAEDAAITRVRHRKALESVVESLGRVLEAAQSGEASFLECVAEDIRGAAKALGSITGHWGTEEVLEQIFQQFCIGK